MPLSSMIQSGRCQRGDYQQKPPPSAISLNRVVLAVRAYNRGELTLSAGDNPGEFVDNEGTIWQLTEDALISG